jgi:two-component system LytT family sensor kinase
LGAELKLRSRAELPGFWTLQAAGWGCVALSALIADLPSIADVHVLRYSGSFLAWTFVASCFLRFACRSLAGRGLSWIALEVRAFFLCAFAGLISGCLAELTGRGYPLDWYGWVTRSVQSAFILFVWCSLYFSIKTWQQATRERERFLRAEAETRDARLSALRYQLNPHFLFNSLNAVSTLVLEGNSVAATRMLAQIGDFLRTMLDTETKLEIPLSEEVAFIEQYLAIEQTRLGSRLHTDVSISAETLDAMVPSMLLQPLVENAVRHGVAPCLEGGGIKIRSHRDGIHLKLIIRNSGPADQATLQRHPTTGVGLSNTAERLKTLYPDRHGFSLEWLALGGCEVLIELPFRKAETT